MTSFTRHNMTIAFGLRVPVPVLVTADSPVVYAHHLKYGCLQRRHFYSATNDYHPARARTHIHRPITSVAGRPEDSSSPPIEWIFENSSDERLLQLNSSPTTLPILLYICGLGAEPLAPCQVSRLRSDYSIISLSHTTNDTSDWDTLVNVALSDISKIRSNTPSPITIVAESFGAVFALRLVAVARKDTFQRQVLINPATALLNDSVLQFVCSLLPLLRLDPTQRIAYKLTAVFFFKFILTNESRLDASCIPDGPRWLRSVDINRVKLSTLLHRISLLTNAEYLINDDFIRNEITLPTTLVASARDRLLQSATEVERLAKLLPDVQHQLILPYSAHAALFEEEVDLYKILNFTPDDPTGSSDQTDDWLQDSPKWPKARFEAATDLGKDIYGSWYRLTSPKVYGRENIINAYLRCVEPPTKPRAVLFVGNHGRLGILDTSLLFMTLSSLLEGRKFRALADATHFNQYGSLTSGRWTQFIKDIGAVQATPRNFCKLLAAGDTIVLFPGGGREVCRRRGEKYGLHWQSNADFVRIAAKFNALIVPFSAVGADDAVDILLDGQELQRLPVLGKRLQTVLKENNLSPENMMPLTSFPPRADRFYFKFHDVIDTTDLDSKDRIRCAETFENTQQMVRDGIDELLEIREQDPKRSFYARTFKGQFDVGNKLTSVVGSVIDALSSPLLM